MSKKENQTRAMDNNASDNSLYTNQVGSFHSENMNQRRSPSELKASFSVSPIDDSSMAIPSIRNSTIYTILSSDSSKRHIRSFGREESPVAITSRNLPVSRGSRSPQLSFGSYANHKEYCFNCNLVQHVGMKIEHKQMDFWNAVLYLFDSLKCCGEPNVLLKYQETIIYCLRCRCEISKSSNK